MKKAIALIFLIIIVFFYMTFMNYSKAFTIDMDGYVLSSSQITSNLYNEKLSSKESNIESLKINNYDQVYKQGDKYFIGEREKKTINIDYPVISDDGSRVLNLSNDTKVINENYEKQSLYKDTILASGELYNKIDNERIDDNIYLFMELKDLLFVNSFNMTVTTNTKKINIASNSIIYFTEEEIRYYSFIDEKYKYNTISGIDMYTNISFQEYNLSYYDLLINLSLKEKENQEEPIIPQPTETPIPSPPSDNNEENESNKDNNNDPIYVKPEVKINNIKANVYSVKFDLEIIDPSRRINKNPTFEILYNSQLYMRKSFYNTATSEIVGLLPDTLFQIIGYYNYLNEKGKIVKNTFYEGELKTKNLNQLEEISLQFGKIKSNSSNIEINDFQIMNDKNDEVLKGIKRMVVLIDNEEYNISSSTLSKLKSLEKVKYETPAVLKSNTSYDLEFKMYDVKENELKIKNNKIVVKTSKKEPTASIIVEDVDITKFKANVDINNPDNILLSNIHYVITDQNHKIIKEKDLPSNMKISVNNLNANELYNIILYADYDLEDGEGNRLNQKLKETKISTSPISTLGFLRVNLSNSKITQNEANFNFEINLANTEERLVELLENITINVYYKQDNSFAKKIIISKDEINSLKLGESIFLSITELYSKTEYVLEFSSTIKQGDKKYDIAVLSNVKELKTLKEEAYVEITNKFSTSSMIDFDARIVDNDGAIESDRILLEVRNSKDVLIKMTELKVNDSYKRITLDKLEKDETYIISYIVEEYNVGYSNISYEENKILFKDTIITEEGIIGKIEMNSLLKQITSKNLFDINNKQRWKSTSATSTITQKDYDYEKNSFYLSAENGYRNYSYYLPECSGKEITVSFYAKYEISDAKLPVYLSNGDGNSRNYQLKDLTNTEWKKYVFTFKLNSKGYVGFIIDELSSNNTITKVGFKDLQIELGSSATNYQKYSEKNQYQVNVKIDLNDTRNEIQTDDFYVQVYKKAELIDTLRYELLNGTSVSGFNTSYEVDKDTSYTIKLAVKIRDRFYNINQLEFTTEEEIRTIKDINEFFNVHTNGKYLVVNDLDFTNSNTRLTTPFSGSIDFQGYKILMDVEGSQSRLVDRLEAGGIFKNMDVHIYFNNKNARNDYYGIIYNLHGTVSNLKLTIEESTVNANSVISLIAYVNRGVIENFVINAKASLYGRRWVTYGCLHNYGVMKNGYAYGKALNAIYPTNLNEPKRFGIFAGYTSENSRIENVFSLIDINVMSPSNPDITDNDKLVGNIVGQNDRGILKNVYSYASGNNRDLTLDPNIGNTRNAITINAQNLYYASEELYADKYSLKISKLALKDEEFQDNVLNGENKFNISDYVKYGYFPQIIWPDSMPNQEYIELPKVEDEDLIDITSVASISQNGDIATVVLNISNPANEKISDIQIKDLTTKIVKQVTEKGKTKLTIEVSNPKKYVSKYYMKSITSIGAFNISYTRTYSDTERVLQMDLYKTISNIDDWKKIKQSNTENYLLTADIDFLNQPSSIIQIGNFSGKINGNGHTIKNIEILSGESLISTLTGSIENLYVENYNKSSKTYYGGLVNIASTNSLINNVHMKNIKLMAQNQIGALAGQANGAIIKNSSVTGISNHNLAGYSDLRVGGLVGLMYNSSMTNCYAQDVNFDLTTANLVYASGGLIGDISSGSIENVYATGTINTNSQETGGISGRNNGIVNHAYTNLDIYSQNDYLGGIIGNSLNDYVSNTLVVGGVYTSADVSNIGRTIGNKGLSQSNYAWDMQHINGAISQNVNGEELLSTTALNDIITYEQFIKLGDNFDYSKLGDNSLPLLYNSETKDLLPNQKKNYLKEYMFEISNINIYKSVESATILFTIDNPSNYEINNVIIDDLNINKVTKNILQNGKTTYEVEVTPIKYYDSYRISSIKYIKDGKLETYIQETKVPLQFFKDIEKYEDWQKISQTTYENYRLVADIDFSGKTSINDNVVFNRLEGTENGHTLSNIELTYTKDTQALIRTIKNKISNINFKNITINNSKTTNRIGVINYTFGEISDLNFENITINAPNVNYSGIISEDRSTDIRNITLEKINVSGKQYVGSLTGRTRYYGLVNIKLNDITIVGKGNYVGGMIGYSDYINQTTHFNITGNNIDVTNTGNYTGGIYGYGSGREIKVTNSNIKGVSYVGGIMGEQRSGYSYNLVIENSEISGSGTNIGGIFGWNRNIEYAYVKNCKIYGTLSTTTNVGGIAGIGDWTMYYCSIIDSEIISEGNAVGGIKGMMNNGSIDRCSTVNITVTGNAYVGGIAGRHQSTTCQIRNSTSNATIKATGYAAGGILGYASNATTDSGSNRIYIYNTIVEKSIIQATYYSGGLIGRVDAALFDGHFYSNIISAVVTTTDQQYTPGIAVGSSDSFAVKIKNLRIYDGSWLIQGDEKKLVANMIIQGIPTQQYITLEQLKTQKTYTDISLPTSYFDYSKLSQGYYPSIKAILSEYLVLVQLPSQTTPLTSQISLSEQALLGSNNGFHIMPTYKIYSSGINSINIEFSNIDNNTIFTINDQTFDINKLVYSFSYNYKEDINFSISDGINNKNIILKATDIRNNAITYNDKYFIIQKERLITNTNTDLKKVLNVYDKYILLENGNIYDVSTQKIEENNEVELELLKETIPLYSFNYANNMIKTYYNFSIIDEETYVDKQILIKNTQVEMIAKSLKIKKDQIIIDSYNNNNYLTILGEDGSLYDLKSSIKLPNNFKNTNIKEITNNINNNTGIIVVIYDNDDIICFNYRNGEIIYKTSPSKKVNIIDYFLNSIKSNENNLLPDSLNEQYNNSILVTQTLTETPLEKIMNNSQQIVKENDYIQVYDPIKQKFEIYDINTIIKEQQPNNNINQITINQSITDVINQDTFLEVYYYKKISINNKKTIINKMIVFLIILVFMFFSVIYLGKMLSREEAK